MDEPRKPDPEAMHSKSPLMRAVQKKRVRQPGSRGGCRGWGGRGEWLLTGVGFPSRVTDGTFWNYTMVAVALHQESI